MANFDSEPYISRLTKRKLRTGRVVTGGIVTYQRFKLADEFCDPSSTSFQRARRSTNGDLGLWSIV